MYFFIEYNCGYYKNVVIKEDLVLVRRGEMIYVFWFCFVIGGYINVWKLEKVRL